MDVDILQESTVPRFAVESDDSDDEAQSSTRPNAPVVVKVEWSGPKNASLIVALGPIGLKWTSGIQGSVQKGRILVDNVEAGKIYSAGPENAVVLVTHLLPPFATNIVAKDLLLSFSPIQVTILDTYSALSYISPEPVSSSDPPILYLQTSPFGTPPKTILPFAPPNMIQSLSASLLSILERPGTSGISALAFFVPSRRAAVNPPRSGPPKQYPASTLEDWERATLVNADQAVQSTLSRKLPWTLPFVGQGDLAGGAQGTRQRGDIGDGGMYI